MRAVLGALSLLIALLVVGLLVKKQLGAVSEAPAKLQAQLPADAAVALPHVSLGATPQQQSQQIQQQIRQTLEATLQQARPLPGEQ
jgi:ABC-type iron transport system FetAB permease component